MATLLYSECAVRSGVFFRTTTLCSLRLQINDFSPSKQGSNKTSPSSSEFELLRPSQKDFTRKTLLYVEACHFFTKGGHVVIRRCHKRSRQSLASVEQSTMRGCALSLTTSTINSIPFLHIDSSQPSFSFPSQSLTIYIPRLKPLPSTSLSIHYHHHSIHAQQHQSQQLHDDSDEEENFQILTSVKTDYNDIMIVDTPTSRMLLLDSSHNVHSILYKERKWTNSYWDEFASLPAIVPKGPIAILGLGGGTAAHLMLELWPSLQLEGWEIDDILIDKARDYFGLSDLEKTTEDGGILNVHIGDVFVPSKDLHRRYAGIVVDLFSDGKVLPQLQEVSTWLELRDRLMANGRFMVNCGGIDADSSIAFGSNDPENLSNDEAWLFNAAMKALSKAFPEQLSWKRMSKETGENFIALTGDLPDLKSWSANVPSPLSIGVMDWRPCGMVSKI